jgi:site-specific recombinase XerD
VNAGRTSNNTTRAYRADWHDFADWCGRRGFLALPARPETVALYLSDLLEAGRARATLQRRLAAIAHAHRLAGKASPSQHALARGVLDRAPQPPTARVVVGVAELRNLTAALPDSLQGRRDRALLLVGFGGRLRRSELVGLDIERLEFASDGLIVELARDGRRIGIPRWPANALCPVTAANDWLDAARLVQGPLFRAISRHGQLTPTRLSDRAVALIVKRAARAAGYDPTGFAGDSLRGGPPTHSNGVEWRPPPRQDAA